MISSSKIWIVRSSLRQKLLFFRATSTQTILSSQKLLESDSRRFRSRSIDFLDIDWRLRKTFFLFFFLLVLSSRYFRLFSIIETTFHKFLIRSTWKSFKTKSITKNLKQKRFLFSSSFFLISTISTQNLFNDEELELLVSQRFETSFFMTIFSSRNSFSSF
jgi:hypothetical protein